MNTMTRKCFRLALAISKSSSYHLRPLCPTLVKQERFCSKLFNFENVPQDKVDDFDDFEDSSPGLELFENIDFDSIVGDDLEMKKRLQVVILELSMKMQTETLLAPRKLTIDDWCILLEKKNEFSRKNFLKFLYIREKRKETQDAILRAKNEEYQRLLKEKVCRGPLTTNSPMVYSLGDTTLFNRFFSRTIQKKFSLNLALATMFGEDVIIDCNYEEYMNSSGINSCARHIMYLYSSNRLSKNPFNLILCNLHKNSKMMKILTKTLPNLDRDNDYFITTTEKHYLDLYPARKLVYLSPHCLTDMENYDADSVYILGAYVDEGKFKPISASRAKKDGIRIARLPLDKYLNWSHGSKLLPFNVCARILNDVKDGACWQYALRHINIRKQKFQFFDNDIDIQKEQELAAAYVREEANRNMLYSMKLPRYHSKNKTENSPRGPNKNKTENYPKHENF